MGETLTCGCVVEPIDVPDDAWIGHGHRVVKRCPLHACPDGGACHHGCDAECFRVLYCGPLSDVFPSDEWPSAIVADPRPVPIGPEGAS